MQVDAAMSNGERKLIKIDMNPDWIIQASLGDRSVNLALQAVLPSVSTGLIYLFASSAPLDDGEFALVSPLPSAASELLLYAPLVALIKCPEGFQALAWSAWKEITASSCLQDFGMPSSMAASLNGGVEDELDAQSLNSASCGMPETDEEQESDDACEDVTLSDADSDDGSEVSV